MIKSGDSVPEIESINTFLTAISFAVEDLFNNTYEVLNNSLEQYIASDEAIGKLWEQIQNDNDEKDSSDPFKDVVINKNRREDDESYDKLCDRVTDYIKYVIKN